MSIREGAILGFGHVAAQGHLPAWRTRSDARIAAVADIDPTRQALARSLLPGARIYADASALLARERLDFVDIATPPCAHVDLIEQSIRAGCDVLCEKPLVTTLADFARVAAWAQETNVALVAVHNWKHSKQFQHVARLVTNGMVGRVTRIELDTERNGQAITVGPTWRRNAAQAGGGILLDHGWHALYLALTLTPERPQRIHATTDRQRADGGDVEDTVWCRIEFSSSVAEIRLTWAATQRRTRWQVAGTAGSIDLEEDRLKIRTRDRQRDARFAHSLSAGSHHPDWFDAVVDDFFRAIDDPVARYANLVEAQWCITLTSLAYRSAATGRALAVPTDIPLLIREPARSWLPEPWPEPVG